MRERAGLGARHLTFVWGRVGLALVPATASAVTSAYHPNQNARTSPMDAAGR
jgi:hypothetical protein